MSYETYVMGRDAILYDAQFMDMLKNDLMVWWRMARDYRSIWRTLHIDGLEGNPYGYETGLPKSIGAHVQLFHYKLEAQ